MAQPRDLTKGLVTEMWVEWGLTKDGGALRDWPQQTAVTTCGPGGTGARLELELEGLGVAQRELYL